MEKNCYVKIYEEGEDEHLYAKKIYNMENTTLDPEESTNNWGFKWTHDLTLLLINNRLSREPEFEKPVYKKRELWCVIAQEISSAAGFELTGDLCDTKYRNLLATYKANKRRSHKGESVTWKYYELFDDVLGPKTSFLPSEDVLGDIDSIVRIEGQTSKDRNAIRDEKIEITTQIPSEVKRPKRRALELEEYLYEKLGFEKERRLEGERRKEERWREKKEMKEREIKAIEMLAKAIATNYQLKKK